jgi:hypothetical protein
VQRRGKERRKRIKDSLKNGGGKYEVDGGQNEA